MALMTPKAKQRFRRDGAAFTNWLVRKLESQIRGLVDSEAFFFYTECCMNMTCAVKLRNAYSSQFSQNPQSQ
jgi:hypothetical protein